MPSRHILIVNARKVTQPVFVIGAPHSGAEAVGRALKISPGFHVTIGQHTVLQAVYAFARRPSLYSGRGEAACGAHGIVSEVEMIRMDEINEAYERLLKSDVKYRFVIDMASLKE